MNDAKLLTDDELRLLASASEDSLSARQLLSHIAAQAAEIERLGAVPETLNRFTPDSDDPNVMHDNDKCDYVNYHDVVASIGGVQ